MKNSSAEMFTIGADVEMFLKSHGKYVAVQPYVKGTKKKPQPLPNSGGNVQRDNVAIEFGIVPSDNKDSFVRYVGSTLRDVVAVLPKDVSIEISSSADFPKDQLEHKECKEFACSPDYNAWTMSKNVMSDTASEGTLRSCGGHIHYGFIPNTINHFLVDEDGKAAFIRLLDHLLGSVSVILDNSDASIKRRTLYGKAGCYRNTSYGVEYRTLSNFWIKSPLLTELMYELSVDAVRCMNNEAAHPIMMLTSSISPIREVIQDGNVGSAEKIVDILAKNNYISEDSYNLYTLAKHGMLDTWGGVNYE